ncbi:hypothetical protein WMY93_010526 [Mugilogobius chulae]|uniref:Uncharacterized protein n=1 Tax=Mugilogobius chulae TaxID=88201 RepID=A0AAW0PB91_9GOBI
MQEHLQTSTEHTGWSQALSTLHPELSQGQPGGQTSPKRVRTKPNPPQRPNLLPCTSPKCFHASFCQPYQHKAMERVTGIHMCSVPLPKRGKTRSSSLYECDPFELRRCLDLSQLRDPPLLIPVPTAARTE